MSHALLPSVLLGDDKIRSLEAMKMALEDEFEVFSTRSAEDALRSVDDEWVQVVPCDQRMPGAIGIEDRVERIEAHILRETPTRLRWNKSRAAEELGLSRAALRARLDRYGIEPPVRSVADDDGAPLRATE